ncbi:LytR C-terminal domain-containing protein [Pseudarthrobacter albicanus]|uniref:LytR C-terminal domain-containing protein n=1 Tax=Pseudarthrobacter albicanus TaxID=2823873 RepID=UPI001BAD3F3A|nr:LytR C-terminal domain-containing protein [Pseudarthrobacter albicanus]
MARKPKDVKVLHGHRVVTASDLDAALVPPEDTEGNRVRRRRRILHAVVLALLAGLIAAAIVTALAIMNGQLKVPTAERSSAAASPCPDATFDYTPPEKITVSVFNATNRPGLARIVADGFAARKFIVGAVGNTTSSYRGVALVVSGAAGQSAAFSVQRNLPGSDYVQDGRTDPGVDVILTGDYKELAKPELVDQTPGKLSCPREARRIVDEPPLPVPTAVPPGG